ncbi:SUKH-4 family immunity protein [Roseimaritima ulvae]|nr:SUKH-4 family immunity protein [Roseimaritima ulvae]
MTPAEFKSRYVASLPEVPEELREELDLDRFVVFDPGIVAAYALNKQDAAILTEVGLPNSAAPWLTFELDPKRRLAPIDGFPNMLAIGSNAYGDYVCLDMEFSGEVVYINHDNLNDRVLINSSVFTLAESLCLYLTHRHRGEPKNLLAAIGSIDPAAIVAGTFWHHEAISLAEGGG